MKKVNFDPELEMRKIRIMEEFDRDNGPVEEGSEPGEDTHARPAAAPVEATEPVDPELLKENVIEALKTVYDPEIPVNIYDLGLIYEVRIDGSHVDIDMTLTAPGCPVAHTFPGMVERSVELVDGVGSAAVELVWDPPWTPELISEAARLELGLV